MASKPKDKKRKTKLDNFDLDFYALLLGITSRLAFIKASTG